MFRIIREAAFPLLAVLAALMLGSCSDSASSGGQSAGSNQLLTGHSSQDQPTGDKFQDVGTNPFVLTAADPFSTFAADVDTASYEIFRRNLLDGVLPPQASVRLEEYVNYFRYGDPVPAADAPDPITLTAEAAPNPWQPGTLLLRVALRGRDARPEELHRAANLVFLVDVSGSMMASDKLPLVQKVLTETLEVLRPTDRVAIVTYAGSVGVRLASTPVSDKGKIKDAIAGLEAGGSTAGAAGLDLAYAQAQANFLQGGINHVLLCTDGDFNVGTSSTKELVETIVAKRKTGITLTVLGFGLGNLNDAMMEAVSDAGNGVYGFIGDTAHATEYVHERLLSTVVRIAADVKIQIAFNPSKVQAYRLLGYENRMLQDSQFVIPSVDAGDMGVGHAVTALYELVPAGAAIPAPAGAPAVEATGSSEASANEATGDTLCLVKVKYKPPGSAEQDPSKQVARAFTQDQTREWAKASSDLRWAASVATVAEVLHGSPFRTPADLTVAGDAVATSAGDDPARLEFVKLLAKARALLAPK